MCVLSTEDSTLVQHLHTARYQQIVYDSRLRTWGLPDQKRAREAQGHVSLSALSATCSAPICENGGAREKKAKSVMLSSGPQAGTASLMRKRAPHHGSRPIIHTDTCPLCRWVAKGWGAACFSSDRTCPRRLTPRENSRPMGKGHGVGTGPGGLVWVRSPWLTCQPPWSV